MFTVWNGKFSWVYSSQGMELITHPNLVLMLRTSRSVPLLFLCATIGMLLSVCYLLHTRGWLFINSVFMYQQKRRAVNNKSVKSKEFIKKVSFYLASSSYLEISKRAQLNVSFQNITLLFFLAAKWQIFRIYLSESSNFLVSLVKKKMVLRQR